MRLVFRFVALPGQSAALAARIAPLLAPPSPGSQEPLWVYVRNTELADTIDLVGFFPAPPGEAEIEELLTMLRAAAGDNLARPPRVITGS